MPNFNSITCKRMEGSTNSKAALEVQEKKSNNEAGVEGCNNDVVVHFHDGRVKSRKT